MGKELGGLVHGNRLVKANVDGDELQKRWARPSVKDELHRRNNIPDKDFVLSTDDNSQILSQFLANADIDDIVQEDDVDWPEVPSREQFQQDNIPPHIPVLQLLLPPTATCRRQTHQRNKNPSNIHQNSGKRHHHQQHDSLPGDEYPIEDIPRVQTPLPNK